MKGWFLGGGALLLAACGYVGPPMPPTLDIPVTVTDFRAWEYGENIEFEFTLPDKTTENLPLTNVRAVELRIGEDSTQGRIVALPANKPGLVADRIPAQEWIGRNVVLSVRAVGPKGKPAGWSNPASLAVIAPLAAPSEPRVRSVASGVELTWTGANPHYRIFRAEEDAQPQVLADTDQARYLDESTTYGTHYRYMVQAIAGTNQWSLLSSAAEITPEDKFPPAVPEGLSAVGTPASVELAWTRNTETDFRGYNIYRSVDNQPFEKIASMIEAPAFSDSKIEPGKKYRYAVSAVDQTGNESARTAPVEGGVQ